MGSLVDLQSAGRREVLPTRVAVVLLGGAAGGRGRQHGVDAGAHGGLGGGGGDLDAHGQMGVFTQRHRLTVSVQLQFDHVGGGTGQTGIIQTWRTTHSGHNWDLVYGKKMPLKNK